MMDMPVVTAVNWTPYSQSLVVTGFNGIHVCALCELFVTSSFARLFLCFILVPNLFCKVEHSPALWPSCIKWVIDLYQYAPVYDQKFKEHFYLYGHLNAQGYVLTAKMIASYIDYIIRSDTAAFQNTPFIGTGVHYEKAERQV